MMYTLIPPCNLIRVCYFCTMSCAFQSQRDFYNFLQFNSVTANAQSVNLSAHVDKLCLYSQIPFQLFAFTQVFSPCQPARSVTVLGG